MTILAAFLLVFAWAGPPEQVDVVAIEPPPAPALAVEGPEPAPQPEPTDAIEVPEPEPEPAPTWQAELFVDIFYAVNSNSPENHVLRGFTTAPRSGEIVPNVVGGFIRHRATDEEPWWFELGLHAGAGVDALVAAEPVAGGADGRFAGVEVFKHIALANAGFRIRKTKTSLGAGVLESPFGLSSFWSFRNTTYTPMYQNNIVPYYFAGARISQEIKGGLTLSGWLVNGAQTYSDANKAPSGVASLSWSPAPRKGMQALTINSHVLFGPEGRSIAAADWFILWDSTITWAFDEHFSMGAAWDLSIENPGRPKQEQNLYTGGGILARGTVMELKHAKLDLVVRPDFLWDRDGRFFGVSQWLISPSAGADLALWERLTFRVQYRYDYSTNPDGFFYRGEATTDGGPGLARQQHTVYFALVGLWDFWFGRRGPPK
ncbi:outer membrane beta-barrel protein [Nannocystaceae bacterium ST9]